MYDFSVKPCIFLRNKNFKESKINSKDIFIIEYYINDKAGNNLIHLQRLHL